MSEPNMNPIVVEIATGKAYIEAENTQLTSQVVGFGSGGGGPVEPTIPIKDYIDARDDAIESRLTERLSKVPTKGTVWTAVATGTGLLLALLAFGGDRFDGGVGASGLIREQAEQQAKRDADQDARLELMDQKLDILIRQTSNK